ncbi:MAG: DUF2333 family protein [Candidatus Thiothrix singaporensis]|uniref:DUF2333 family protein n=1 Tax=Candidatus Thiothrix singaporensis TaxID=2799669 RepID=A0A7L6AVJ2_9GAMM|nr:MAG: DUF2333 family protein [Candidatus Thiothrix singaporensis]
MLGFYHPKTWKEKGLWWTLGLFLITYLIVVLALGLYWSNEPDTFDVSENAKLKAEETKTSIVPGFTTTATLINVANTLLDKPGGYLSNDVTPPGVYLDNIPEWEFGVLVQIRDMARTFRNDFSRSQSQSTEDKDLIIAEPHFNFDSESWLFPPTETEYRTSIKALDRYLLRLSDPKQMNAQFYARADNLRDWLAQVEKRLGSLSQRLSASVGQENLNLGLAGDSSAQQSTPTPSQQYTKTPWTQIDNVFYEARGQSWALLHFLKAVETDFAPVLDKKNARISLQQIIRELESTQQTIWSPMILNGNGFGFVTNHSLIMASYLSRANAAVIDLRRLLEQG